MKKSLLIFMIVLLVATFASAEEISKTYKEYVIKVTGTGKAAVEPDSFSLDFLVESESVNLRRATKENTEKIAEIMKEIKKLNIPNLEFSTSIFSFVGDKKSTFIFPNNKYKVRNSVVVKAEKLEYDKLSDYASDAIDAAIQNGATRVGNLSFYLENQSVAEDQALKAAIENAKNRASFMAKELGVTLKAPYNLLGFWVHQPYTYVGNVMMMESFALKRGMADTAPEVAPGKETFTAQVELEFKFE